MKAEKVNKIQNPIPYAKIAFSIAAYFGFIVSLFGMGRFV